MVNFLLTERHRKFFSRQRAGKWRRVRVCARFRDRLRLCRRSRCV